MVHVQPDGIQPDAADGAEDAAVAEASMGYLSGQLVNVDIPLKSAGLQRGAPRASDGRGRRRGKVEGHFARRNAANRQGQRRAFGEEPQRNGARCGPDDWPIAVRDRKLDPVSWQEAVRDSVQSYRSGKTLTGNQRDGGRTVRVLRQIGQPPRHGIFGPIWAHVDQPDADVGRRGAGLKQQFQLGIAKDVQGFCKRRAREDERVAIVHALIAGQVSLHAEANPIPIGPHHLLTGAKHQLDPLTVAFTLKDQLGFTDGYGQLTADDVKFSIERIADPASESPYAGDWATLKEVEVKDTLSGLIHLNAPFAPLCTSTLPSSSGIIVSRKAVTDLGGKITTKPVAQSGPYILKEWLPKQRTVLVRNPDWKYEQGAYDEIHITPIEDEKTAELGFEAGDLDYTWTSASSISRLKAAPPPDSTVLEKPSLAFVWLGMNKDVAPFDNPNIRRAVQYAIDTKSVVDAAYYGAAATATGIIAPGLPGHRDANLYGYDPDKARELLAQEGVEGLTITLDILNKTERLTAAQVVQANLADVGITCEIKQHDSGTFWTLGSNEGDTWDKLQMIIQRFSMQPDPSWATAWFITEQVGVWNWERFSDAEFDELNTKGQIELDPAIRDTIYKRMQDIMEESGQYVFLTHEVVGVEHRNSVVPALLPNGMPLLNDFKPA